MSATPVSSTPQSYAEQISAFFSSYMGRVITCLQDAGSYILTTITAIWNRATQWFSPENTPTTAPQQAVAASAPVEEVEDTTQYHTPLLDFYRGTTPDASGLRFCEIVAFSDDELIDSSRYASSCFPTLRETPGLQSSLRFTDKGTIDHTPPPPEANSMELDSKAIAAFHREPQLKTNLQIAFRRMLHFYGLSLDERNMQVHRAYDFNERKSFWLTKDHPQHIVIARILNSLCTLGLPEHARAFKTHLDTINEDANSRLISDWVHKQWNKPFLTPQKTPQS